MPKLDIPPEERANMLEQTEEGAEAVSVSLEEKIEPITLLDGMTQEERDKELTGYLKKAVENHLTPVDSPILGFNAFLIDTDIPLYTADKPTYLNSGIYLFNQSEDINKAYIHTINFNENDLQEIMEGVKSGEIEADKTGYNTYKIKDVDIKIHGEVKPVEIEKGKPLLYLEALTFLAMKDAETIEERTRVFVLGFLQITNVEVPPARPGRGKARPKGAAVIASIDQVTNALFGRGLNHLEPQDYHSGEYKNIPTGKGLSVGVMLQTPSEITAPESEYVGDDPDRFWHDNLATLAMEGHTSIAGSDLLRLGGYSNPYAETMGETMQKAFNTIRKLANLEIALDVTEEKSKYYQKRGKDLQAATRLTHVINADIEVNQFNEDGKIIKDFSIELKVDETGEPLTALPVANYAKSKGMLIAMKKEDLTFQTIKRLSFEHRQMWRYILRNIQADYRGQTISFETMFRELGFTERLEAAIEAIKQKGLAGSELNKAIAKERNNENKRRQRMLDTLRKMLNERKAEGTLSYTWKKDNSGVTIEMKDKITN